MKMKQPLPDRRKFNSSDGAGRQRAYTEQASAATMTTL